MSVLQFKPHSLCYQTQTEGYEDDNGDYISGTSSWSDPVECDAVASQGQEGVIDYGDGVKVSYTYTVYLDTSIPDLKRNDKVKICLYDNQWHEFTVKGFLRYQLQCKLWL